MSRQLNYCSVQPYPRGHYFPNQWMNLLVEPNPTAIIHQLTYSTHRVIFLIVLFYYNNHAIKLHYLLYSRYSTTRLHICGGISV